MTTDPRQLHKAVKQGWLCRIYHPPGFTHCTRQEGHEGPCAHYSEMYEGFRGTTNPINTEKEREMKIKLECPCGAKIDIEGSTWNNQQSPGFFEESKLADSWLSLHRNCKAFDAFFNKTRIF